jgi:hypothetical protein
MYKILAQQYILHHYNSILIAEGLQGECELLSLQ